MKYKIFHKINVSIPDYWVEQFDTPEECVAYLTTLKNTVEFVVVDTETNEWFDGYTLTHPPVNYKSLFSYSLA